jgi:sugar phosphate isomerase/epimerase
MVQFGTGYDMPMDRDYGESSPSSNSTKDVGLGIKDIGMSLGLGPIPNVAAVGAKVRTGARTIELGFMGSGKGGGQGHTPGMYGKVQRQALREMQKANKVDFTTHASVGVYGLAGMDQQGNFSKQNSTMAIHEIKRAIEFAADVGKGGPVVVHTGEFQRPMFDADWNKGEEWKDKFKLYADEEERAAFRVVDTRTGGVIQEARKNRKVARPVWNRYNEESKEWKEYGGNRYKDENGNWVEPNSYIDYFGNVIDPKDRVPVFDPEKDHFKVRQMGWEDLVDEAKELTQRFKKEYNEWDNLSETEKKESIWRERIKETKLMGLKPEDVKVRPEEAYIIATLETNASHARGWAYQYGGAFDEEVDRLKKLKEALKFYEKLESGITDPDEKELMKKESGRFSEFVPVETKLPTHIIQKQIRQVQNRMEQSREAASSQWAQAEEAMETIRHVKGAEEYALNEAYDAYATSAIKAMEESNRLGKDLKQPIALAMENLFPESYGSHPDELIKLVEGSRKRMQYLLEQRGMDKEKAKKEAEEHLTSTFDTGHMNMWRKYWQGDPKKTLVQNDKEFDRWMLGKVKQMVDRGVIGHIHLDDNYGYHDDHLAPGDGNTPITEIMKIVKDSKYKGRIIVEPGADYTTDTSGFRSLAKTWKMFGSSVYGAAGSPSGKKWGQVEYGWFGQNQPPYFTFGGYSPSEDWTLWSGVQLE